MSRTLPQTLLSDWSIVAYYMVEFRAEFGAFLKQPIREQMNTVKIRLRKRRIAPKRNKVPTRRAVMRTTVVASMWHI